MQQEDTLLSNLTVRESLSFSLDLRVSPSRMTSAERKARVGSVIDALNLSRVADSKACMLSTVTILPCMTRGNGTLCGG